MAGKRIKLSEFAGELRNFQEKSFGEIRRATKIGVFRSLNDLIKASPIDTGEYASSWDFLETEKSLILGNFAPHAAIIEFGARPFTQPIGPLLAWAKRVLQDPSNAPNYSGEVWALAKGVQNKISVEGMMPKHVLKNALPQIIQNIISEINRL